LPRPSQESAGARCQDGHGARRPDLLVSLSLWFEWAAAPVDPYGFRFVVDGPWIESLGIRYIVGVDGISMLLVLLTTVLGFLAILSS
jgi:NADH-quinone oxidoreductase subunit M